VDLAADDEMFNGLLASIFQELAGTIDCAPSLCASLEQIKSLSKEGEIEITDELLIYLSEIVAQLARGSSEPSAVDCTIDLVQALARRSEPFRRAALEVIAASHGGGLPFALKSRLLEHSSPEFAAVIGEIAALLAGPCPKGVTEHLLQLMTEVVQVDGVDAFKESVAKVFRKFVWVPGHGDDLLRAVVNRANGEWLVGLVGDACKGRSDERPPWLLKRINDWIGSRKELKKPLIKAVRVSREALHALRPTYGKTRTHLPADLM
jgi:hypothetical protein